MPGQQDFQEIAHCGGRVTFKIRTHEGQRQYSIRIQHDRPVAAAWFGLYALPQGIPVQGFVMGGIGAAWDPPPPTPDCIPVFIASDQEGMFGRHCQHCDRYWRTRWAAAKLATICPYCGVQDAMHVFTTEAQHRYIEHYTSTLRSAVGGAEPEIDVVIDMDVYADRVNEEVERPPFYHAEERQQSRWRCSRCQNDNDILGHYGYCSACAYRNNAVLLGRELADLKERCEVGPAHEHLKDAVSHFEGFGRDLVERLLERVPMTPARANTVRDLRFHNVSRAGDVLLSAFDIDLFAGMNEERRQFVHRKFLRRNLYEHRAGVVDQDYLDASGDEMRLGQRLSEHSGDVRRLIDLVELMAANFDSGFHSVLPPREI
jgi:hypothetical protein